MIDPSQTDLYQLTYLESLATTDVAGQVDVAILGMNVKVTPFVLAASDADAATAGVPVGGCYVYSGSTPMFLKARLV
jgi:hypothetical protein